MKKKKSAERASLIAADKVMVKISEILEEICKIITKMKKKIIMTVYERL